MKKTKTIYLFILVFLMTGFISKAQESSSSGNSETFDITGAWELVYAQSVSGDKILREFPGNKTGNQIKIWSENHFASIRKSQDGDHETDYYSAGTYTLDKNRYQETILFHNNKIWVGAKPQKYFEIKGDTLYQIWPVNDSGEIDKAHYSLEKYIKADAGKYHLSAIKEIPDEMLLHIETTELLWQAKENIQTKIKKNMKMPLLAENIYPSQFRGTNCCGVALGAHPPVSLLPDENLAWKTEIANGVSSPCVWGDQIFLTGFKSADSTLLTYCINRKTGAILWKQTVYTEVLDPIHPVGSQAAATPTTDGKNVYAYFGSYGVICYDFKGNLVWEKKLPVLKTRYGSCASPVILKDKLILNRFEVDNPVVLALEPSTGETIWKTNLSTIPGLTESLQRSQSTPVLWNDQIILHRSLALISVNIDDGHENWSIPLVCMGTSTPVIVDDVLFVNGYSNLGEARLYDKLPDFNSMLAKFDKSQDSLMQYQEIPEDLAFFRRPDLDLPLKHDTLFSWNLMAPSFDISQDKALNEQEWKGMEQFWSQFYEEHGVVAINLKNAGKTNASEYLWKENEFIAEVPSLLLTGSQVYMITNGGIITCMNGETGEVVYREKLSAPGAYIASPLMANEHIYFVSYNGRITVVKPGDKLNVVSRFNLKEKVAASPVASDNQLFVRTKETLYAFGE